MILTVVQCYVSENDRYANGFVHSRVKNYIENGIESKVFVVSNNKKEKYIIDGVTVITGNSNDLVRYVKENDISAVCFHFLNVKMVRSLKKIEKNIPYVIFVHGNEALHWYERIFPDRFNGIIRTLKFFKYVIINSYSIGVIRRFFKKTNKNIQIVCVSEWMKNITIKNWKLKNVKIHIIPNIINEKLFDYQKKDPQKRYNILMIRNFTSGKYALDIAMDTIVKLSKFNKFSDIHITIYGDGWLFDKYTSIVKEYKNVEIHRGLLPQEKISEIHKENGIFLCPTRQDAQGVSMCEAMSSGLVPITLNNTAIPEFLPLKYKLALNNSNEMADRIIQLINDENEFQKLSSSVSKFINEKCSIEKTTMKELELIKKISSTDFK